MSTDMCALFGGDARFHVVASWFEVTEKASEAAISGCGVVSI